MSSGAEIPAEDSSHTCEQEPYSCVIIGAGMVGTATAAHLAQLVQKGGPVASAFVGPIAVVGLATGTKGALSSHDDYSRLVDIHFSSHASEAARSISAYRCVEHEAEVSFFHETGCLVVSGDKGLELPAGEFEGPASQRMTPSELLRKWPSLNLVDLASGAGSLPHGHFEAVGAGWIDPRAHVRAHKQLAIARGAHLIEEDVVLVARDTSARSASLKYPVWLVVTACGKKLRTMRVAFAIGAWTNVSGLLPNGLSLQVELWGKSVYHARIGDDDASALLQQSMPAIVVKYAPAKSPAAAVSYNGAKSGFYVYFFPPVQYSDGSWYVKIGHSPHDPLIASLNGSSTADKLSRWLASEESDVRNLQEKSADFFQSTLEQLLPNVRFHGGYTSACVTSKTPSGDVLLGPICRMVPPDNSLDCEGLFACAGCNGAGAKFSHEWGRQLAEAIAWTPLTQGPVTSGKL